QGEEQLRVVRVRGNLEKTDVGTFKRIGLIRPDKEGGFLVTGLVEDEEEGQLATAMTIWRPGADHLEVLWQYEYDDELNEWTWFDVESTLGVSSFSDGSEHWAQLSGLKTGTTLVSIPERQSEPDDEGNGAEGERDEEDRPVG